MSLDFPYYQELRRRNRPAALYWIVGDRLYYLGLFTFLFSGSILIFEGSLQKTLIVSATGIAIFLLGGFLKGRAYALGERDGISAAEVYARGARNNSDANQRTKTVGDSDKP